MKLLAGNDTQVCYYFPLGSSNSEMLLKPMRHRKALLTATGLVLTYLLTGCQTLAPKGESLALTEAQSAYQTSPKPSLSPSLKQLVETIQAEEFAASTTEIETKSLETADSEVRQATPVDVWERMRQGFALTDTEHAKVRKELHWYRKQSSHLEIIQNRARPYIHFILNELEKRKMPRELALLPAIESAFQPLAYSPGHAAGIWQFIPSTGRICGLKQNKWYDERRDVVASTRAALDYLKQLNRMFDGDWELALAAYNAGAGTVQKAIRKNREQAKPTDYWSLQLPRETSQYVPRLLALSQIFADPEKYGVTLQAIPDDPYFQTVTLDSQVDLKLAARISGLSLDELRQLNPGFTRTTTPPGGPHKLHLPLDKAAAFRRQLAQVTDDRPLHWTQYKIKRGDSLSLIARRHNIKTETLRQVNKLPNDTIHVGRYLVVPTTGGRLASATLAELKSSPSNRNNKSNHAERHYIVKKGDSLWTIAQAHNVSHVQLAKWNGLSPDATLRPGQNLIIRTNKTQDILVSAADIHANTKSSQFSYEVKEGDSLYRIAERFSVTIPELIKWNSLSDEFLHPGQRIKLYLADGQQTL